MDGFAFLVFVICLILYYVTKRKYAAWLFVSGIGLGMFLGLLWAYFTVTGLLR